WMPYARLAAPIAPSMVLAFVLAASAPASAPAPAPAPVSGAAAAAAASSAPAPHRWADAARLLIAIAAGVWTLAVAGPAGRHVLADRIDLARRARPYLDGAARIASVDIGWPTLATEADIVDLAGLTDPTIAALPGGHTSK